MRNRYIPLLSVAILLVVFIPGVNAACNNEFTYYRQLTKAGSTYNLILINDTYGVSFADGTQHIWCDNSTTLFCYDDSTTYGCYNADVATGTYTTQGNATDISQPEGNLVLWLPLNGTDGTDKSVHNYSLISTSGTPYVSAGKIGYGLRFDGTTDHLNYSDLDSMDGLTDMTICAWYFPYDTANAAIVSKHSSSGTSNYGWILSMEGTPYNFVFSLSNGAGSFHQATTTGGYGINSWYFVCARYTGGQDSYIFVNGVQNGTSAAPSGAIQANPISVIVGDRGNGGYDANGTIDNLMLWNRSLSSDEILYLYNNTHPDNYIILGSETVVGGAPYYLNVTEATPGSPQTYNNVTPLQFNVSYYDDDGILEYVYVNHNFSGEFGNVNMTNYTANDYNLTYNTSFKAGYFEYRYCGVDNASFTNCTGYYNYTIDKAASGVSLVASPSWNNAEETTVTISCDANNPLSTTITFDGVTVSNPYVATHDFGIYTVVCTISDTENYTPSTTTNSLTITTSGFGCTNTDTFAFEVNFTVNTSLSNQTVIDFAALVASYDVKSDLGDVYPVTNNSPAGWTNGSMFVANVTGLTTLTLRFGNAIVGYTYNSTDNTTDDTDFNYTIINEYIKLTFYDERTGTVQIPPNANNTFFIFCSGGISDFNITSERMLVATFERADEVSARVQYSVTEQYMRNYIIDADVTNLNVYLVDADEDQVVQMILTLYDFTGNFGSSAFRVKKYIEGNLRTMTETYFDSENKVIVYLINGDRYSIYVDNGVDERSIGYLYVDSVDLSKSITIGDIITTNSSLANISFSFSNTTDSIIFSMTDTSGAISSVEFFVYNDTGDEIYYANTTNRTAVQFVYTVDNVTMVYSTKVIVHHYTFGLDGITLWYYAFGTTSYVIPHPISIFDDSGLIGNIPGIGTVSNEDLVSGGMILGVAMLFTATTGPIGGIIAALFTALLVFFGWYELNIGIVGIVVIVAILNKMSHNRRVNA